MKIKKFLIVTAGGDARVVTRQPQLAVDEFAYRLTISIPDTWGSVLGEISLTLPDVVPTVEVDEE